ncbi:MAG: NAD(P)H-binding protein [Maricaulaceae bacterium]|jgi:nucleoside-diphosphate-sugar epimerase
MPRTVAVAGAAGALGLRVALRLAQAPDPPRVLALYRTENREALDELVEAGCEPMRVDLLEVEAAAGVLAAADASILTPILTTAGPAARAALAAGAKRVIVFSSNNVALDRSAAVYKLLRAEEALLRAGGGDYTLIRPTMIYGYPGDGNLSRLIELARRSPVMPMPGMGRALQQPIHVDDLAALAVRLIERPETRGRTLAAAGPKPVSQLELYRAAAHAAGRNRLILPAPAALLGPLARLALAMRAPFPLGLAQIARADVDKTPALEDAQIPDGWAPQISLEDGLKRLAEEIDPTRSA